MIGNGPKEQSIDILHIHFNNNNQINDHSVVYPVSYANSSIMYNHLIEFRENG